MNAPSPPLSGRVLVLAGLLVAALAVLAWRLSSGTDDRPVFPPDDFVEYWAAGRLNANGENPYAPELLLPLQRHAGRDTDEAIMMWNPPWTLPMVMPFGLLHPRIAHLLWIVMGFALILFAADRSWLLGGGSPDIRWVAWFLSLTYIPSLFVLQAGQIGTILLLGVVGVMRGLTLQKPWIVGLSAFLIAVKPHLAYLIWPAFGIWMLAERSRLAWLSAAWFVAAILLATLMAMAFNPDVLSHYLEAMRDRTPDQWKSPTLGSWLRELFGAEKFWLQFVPMSLGGAWFLGWAWRRVRSGFRWPDDFFSLLIVSFVTASYGAWPFDVVILLPGVIMLAAGWRRYPERNRLFLAVGYAMWTILAVVLNRLEFKSDHFFWMAPTLLVFWTVGQRPKDEPG